MNEKGRQTKLLAAIAVLAMVVCVFAVAVPSDGVDGTVVETSTTTTPITEWTDDLSITAGSPVAIYVSAESTADQPAEIDPDGALTIYAESGARLTITPASSEAVTVYIATTDTWTQVTEASTGTNATGNTGYKVNSQVVFTGAGTTAYNVTVGDYGFTANTPEATSTTFSVEDVVSYIVSEEADVINYYNPAMIGVVGATDSFEIAEGGSVSVPNGAIIYGNFTITDGETNGSSVEFIVEEVTTGTGNTAVTENKIVASADIGITNDAGSITIANASGWTNGYMDVVAGSVTAAGTINGKIVNTVSNADSSAGTYWADLATAVQTNSNSYVLYPGEHVGDITFENADTDSAVYLQPGASYSGKISVTSTYTDGESTPLTIEYVQSATVNASVDESEEELSTLVHYVAANYSFTVSGILNSSNTESSTVVSSLESTYEVLSGTPGSDDANAAEKKIHLNGVAIGNMTLADDVILDGIVVTLTGTTLIFDGGSIDVNDQSLNILGGLESRVDARNQQIIGTGYVYSTNIDAVRTYYAASTLTFNSIEYSIILNGTNNATVMDTLSKYPAGTRVTITSGEGSNVIPVIGDVQLNGQIITLAGSNPITFEVREGASFGMTNVTIDDTTGAESRIDAANGSAISITNSRLYLIVELDEGTSITVNNAGVVYENTSNDVKVGYGTTLTLRDSTDVNTIDIYGTLVIEGNVTIPANETMNAHDKSTVTVDGSLTILGTATFQAGSETTINGTMNVGQSNNGGAVVNIAGDFTVAANGTMNVNPGVTGDVYSFNTLNAPVNGYVPDADGVYGYAYKFSVYGNLNMNGQMSGYVHDYGTIAFNGSAVTGQTVTTVVYQDVTLNVASFKGTMNVTDAGICDDTMNGNKNMDASTGNQIQLNNVTGATVTVTVDRFDYTVNDTNYRDYRSVMGVYGTLGAVSGTTSNSLVIVNTSSAAYKAGVGISDNQVAYVVVPESQTLGFGTNVSWNISDLIVVEGNVNFVKAVNMQDTKDITGNRNTGILTVTGTVTVTGQVTLPEGVVTVNAMKYSVTDTSTGVTTNTYTNFANANDAALDANQDTIYVLGAVSVTADDEVVAGAIVSFNSGAVLTVDEGVTLTIADGARFSGNNAAIVVDGTMISNDYANDIFITDIRADVVRTEGAVRTWTSLYNAINELGWTDITLSGAVIIDEDLEIPVGTTVTTNVAPVTDSNGIYSIMVKGATLTVNGTLDMQSGAQGSLMIVDNGSLEGEVVVGGTLTRAVLNSVQVDQFKTGDKAVDGVFFTLREGAYSTYYITNMANAGEIVSATTHLVSDVEVCGSVSAQDASFAVDEDAVAYTVRVTGGSNLSMGTLTLNGVTFAVDGAQNTMFTGSVSAPVADGTSNTVVAMNRTAGITFVSYSTMGVNTTYSLGAYSTGYTGSVTVTEGTIGIGYGENTGLTVNDGSSLTIGSGAVIDIAAGRTLTIADADGVIIEGTLNVHNAAGLANTGNVVMTVAGTMNVDVALSTGVSLVITGDLNVLDSNVMAVNAPIIVGTAPTSLGVGGAIAGHLSIASNDSDAYILAYAGADLSQAYINWNSSLNESDAQSTVYNVNGTEYATVYANIGTSNQIAIGGIFGYNVENDDTYVAISLTGYDTGIYDSNGNLVHASTAYRWYNASGETATGYIGSEAVVYHEFPIAEITGVISKDAGIILTIDDLIVGYVGGDMSQTLQYALGVGTHTIAWSERSSYDISNVTVTFNGTPVQNGGTITITADMTDFTIIATGAVPSTGGSTTTTGDDGMGLTDYLLIVLIILIVIMAIMVALRLMRS